MKRSKLLVIILCLTLIVASSTPTFARGLDNKHNDSIFVNVEEYGAAGNAEKWFEEINGGKYYTEITEDYTVSVGIINKTVDCSICYKNRPNEVKSGIFNISLDNQQPQGLDEYLLSYKDAVLSNEVVLESKTYSINSGGNRSDADMILQELYSAGWPHSYTNWLRETRYQAGATGKMYQSVTYSYSRYINWLAVATTTLSAAITLTNLPATVLLKVASFVLLGTGVYTLINDVTISRYNTFAYGTKVLYVEDIYQYYSGRTVKWIATVGDIGCSLEFKYDNQYSDYNDHDTLFTIAFNNYFNTIY